MFRLLHKQRNQAITWLLLFCIAYLSTGIAIFPQTRSKLANQGRYPCERRGCGCNSAQQCWDSCCCFNDTEKVEWAKRNHVQVPPEVLARVNRLKASKASKAPPRRACCAHCQSCPTGAQQPDMLTAQDDPNAERGDGPSFGLIALFQKCNGLALYQAVFANAVCKTPEPAWTPSFTCIAWLCAARFRMPPSLQCPPTPPPPQAFV